MPLVRITAADALQRLGDFDTVIDARSESEFEADRLPGAVNWPALRDAERAAIGTEYAQVSPFTAQKRGAVLVARNIAAHIERELLDTPKGWKPLVYCWRGGKRSGALATVLDQIGFRVHVIDGGYRDYRRAVVVDLERLPARFDYQVLGGSTGSGKSRLLQVLARLGAQVLDLEALAEHRGSVLGLLPGTTQPSQKQFESRVWNALNSFDPLRPVFVESESKKVGDLRVPERLIERMRASALVEVELPVDARVALLIEDYDHFVTDTAAFCARLYALRAARGGEVVGRWQDAARAGRTVQVVRALLTEHYDPIYRQSLRRNFAQPVGTVVWDGTAAGLEAAARALVAGIQPRASALP